MRTILLSRVIVGAIIIPSIIAFLLAQKNGEEIHDSNKSTSTSTRTKQQDPSTFFLKLASTSDYPLSGSDDDLIMSKIRDADKDLLPKPQKMPDGSIRFTYIRNSNEPKLTIEQIKSILKNPPTYAEEQEAILSLLKRLRQAGAIVVLGKPSKDGAAGEWNPRRSVLRIRANVPAKGSRRMAVTLNHEAIHVAQSCKGGGVSSQPQLLGIPSQLNKQERLQIADPIYATSSREERALESEAYANQNNLDIGIEYLNKECKQEKLKTSND